MEDKHLKKIADELGRLNRSFEKLIVQLETSRKVLVEETTIDAPAIGSTGDKKESEK
jgi:hypothetical protein